MLFLDAKTKLISRKFNCEFDTDDAAIFNTILAAGDD